MQEVLARPAFAVDGQWYLWRDVVAAAKAWGDWQRLEEDVRRARLAETREPPPAAAEVQRAADEFRYDRRLLAADDMEAWLAEWGLTTDDWVEYVRRSLLSGHDPDDQAVELDPQVVWTQAVCSGTLERLARRLAERLAVYASLEDESPAIEELGEVDERFERFLDGVVTADSVESVIAAHTVEWTRLECLWLEAPTKEVAREAVLCVREDRRALEDVARDSDLTVEHRRIYLDDADREIAPLLLGARAGDLIGPIGSGAAFAVVLVEDRVVPVAGDDAVTSRAERHVREQAVGRAVLQRVRWATS
jgi:hypothetical protein